MVTLEDIAREIGVSHSTVSRALADSPLVNAATKERIQQRARELGYEVNQVARNLKVRSTGIIGLIVPEVSNPFYPKLVQLIADRAREAGYSLQLHLSGADQSGETACLTLLRSHRADGILLITGERGLVAREMVMSLTAAGAPLVLMGWVADAEKFDLVTGDDARGGYELAQHLIALGHRRIAILGKNPHRGQYDRLVGFEEALREAGIALRDELFLEAQNEEDIETGIQRLLALDDCPTAIFAYQDSLAALVYKYLRRENIAIPAQMSVAGFDDLELATYLYPNLTTVGGHMEPLATAFVELLVERIRQTPRTGAPEHRVITPQVIVRDSCECIAPSCASA